MFERKSIRYDTLHEIFKRSYEIEKKITLYSYVSRSDLESVLSYGLAGSRGIINNKELLNHIFPNTRDRQSFVNRFDEDDITLQGPSVFFHKPVTSKILEIDPDHHLGKEEYILLAINFGDLNDGHEYRGIHGVELIPYEDEDYIENKKEIEHLLDMKEIIKLSKASFDDSWAEYKKGFFAANVPHGIVIMKNGIIPPNLISIA